MNCQDPIQQNPAKIFRSGIWKQWIYWMTPGPDAYAAIQRVVAEVNNARLAAGAPLLVTDPTYPLIVSVFDESNPRGINGSAASREWDHIVGERASLDGVVLLLAILAGGVLARALVFHVLVVNQIAKLFLDGIRIIGTVGIMRHGRLL